MRSNIDVDDMLRAKAIGQSTKKTGSASGVGAGRHAHPRLGRPLAAMRRGRHTPSQL